MVLHVFVFWPCVKADGDFLTTSHRLILQFRGISTVWEGLDSGLEIQTQALQCGPLISRSSWLYKIRIGLRQQRNGVLGLVETLKSIKILVVPPCTYLRASVQSLDYSVLHVG